MVDEDLVFGFEGLGVVHFAGGGDGVKIGRGYLLDDLAASGHLGEIGGALGCAGGLVSGDDGAGEEGLAELNLALGEGVFGDF